MRLLRRFEECFVVLLFILSLPAAGLAEDAISAGLDTKKDLWPEPVMDSKRYGFFLLDQLEYRLRDGEDTFSWEQDGWYGGDYERVWIKTEGDQSLENENGETEVQILYSRVIAPFWDLQAGVRYDQAWGADSKDSRFFGVLGLEGLAPYFFEIEPAFFISEEADISVRLTATSDVLFSQRIILQPRFEINVAAHEAKEFGVAEGVTDLELGVRIRYEIKREFAPYVGISWERKVGETAGFARRAGEEDIDFSVVFGTRLWF